ncbi:MAG: response regulator [Chloroflexi bacterium]|nr:response regulator [Chloroflexota bacterium]
MIAPRILIVEDNRIVSLDIQIKLEALGYLVVGTAASGEVAIKTVSDLNPNLVFMDINLEGAMDGIEAARQIQREYNVPIIFLTAYADDDTKNRAMRLNPSGYILKPYSDHQLQSSIRDVFSGNILN